MTFRAGTAQVIITPPVGVELSGYAFGPSVGVLDDLEAQTVVLENGADSVALVTADLIGFGPELVDGVRTRVEAELGIPADRVLMSASHTHSGPATAFLRHWGTSYAAYIRSLESQIVGLVAMAQRDVQEARVGVGLGDVDNIGENRRAGKTVIDPAVPVLRFDNADGQTMAVLCNYACHPVSLHSYKNLISPDYPGYMREVVRGVLGDEVTVMFTLGAAGDINPSGYVAGGTTPERSRQIGAILGCEVTKIALGLEPGEATLQVGRAVVDLPVEPLPSPSKLREIRDVAEAEAVRLEAEGRPWPERAVAQIRRDWAADGLRAWESGRLQPARRCEIQGIRLGDAAILALPLEVFVETGLAVKAESPAKITVLCSNSNGALGYVPTKHAYEVENDYTNPQGLAPKVYDLYAFSAEAEPLVRQEAIRVLEALWRGTA